MRLIPSLLCRHRDIERLLSGKDPRDGRLAMLSTYASLLRRAASRVPPDDEVLRFAAQAAQLAGSAPRRPSVSTVPTPSHARALIGLSPRAAAALIALAVMLTTSVGVAYAADYAVPGDTLYKLDRALEDFGIADGGLPERLAESEQLFRTGRFTEGLTSAAAAIAESPDERAQEAAAALLAAAEVVSGSDDAHTGQLRAQVADSLLTLASTDLSDLQELGNAIEVLAHGLSAGSSAGQGGASSTTVTSGYDSGVPSASPGSSDDQQQGPHGSPKNGR